jgi:predicted nucleic acid-binding protein
LSLVLDPSVVLAWAYTDEGTPATAHVLDLVAQSGAVVPAIWHLEVANALQQGLRRGRIDKADRDSALFDLIDLDIEIDSETSVHAWTATLNLAETHGLTVYDAAYLELARRRNLRLASLDRELRAAAEAIGVGLLGF